jgi:hypothetical protein
MFTHALSFAAGVVTGWTARSVLGSSRELAVRAMALSMGLRERLHRTAAEQVEWWEDMVAEARARSASFRGADAAATDDHDERDDAPMSAAH